VQLHGERLLRPHCRDHGRHCEQLDDEHQLHHEYVDHVDPATHDDDHDSRIPW